ncbi:bifunctional response regulator/alkaline phosphatase family protein [Tenacibaculum finnmarkense genomovar finnmarkense]|uniref:Two-component system response regulator n=2 Tax=Tenacibaculum finnmarkense TaxID=2781243 RepID=A0A2I2LFW7_9FLAO|nr:bifunctional response regulator/alkaline phosphatase family protein [Tenacibaculum finnmarkense]MBE7647715.1 PglZ domain-containing protein [Tenacibaculum finnmarkense genomovar ulcerans]MBE7652777.1 PglZ domain-containing protein [Tenacibaculum finnmarkense genomovar finnmarkense]MBE7659816.1 PglZ domain-containing protein [Tenacibaculum finnmarkense genomovar finnmarkense]MBE7687508.1 PglZ domain-containing protein [Tenacibaculum finnmarkense genomovar ulcerans]MBE7695177.1 PglZ domain-co
MKNIEILWVDDEIDLLKPHILFLEKKNYLVTTATNGADAIDLVSEHNFDIVFLDENMPGITGLETLALIKQKNANLPVVMITKSEEETIMEEAIGSKIADYLIKPVNPNQILLSLKKNLDHSRLISEKTTANYQQEFRKISMDLAMVNSHQEWVDLYKKLVHWELELEHINDAGMLSILESQKAEANSQFFKFIKKNYQQWLTSYDKPTFSHTLFKDFVVPELPTKEGEKGVLLVVLDNLRYDQYRVLEPFINTYYKKEEEHSYYSILPTATQYARNAIFSGLMPLEMEKKHPDLWKNDTDQGGKNLYEPDFLEAQIKRLNLHIKHEYYKIVSLKSGKELADNYNGTKQNDLTVIVYNFVDMLSHAKTEMEVIKELAGDDKAYRSLTVSWFKNSPLYEIIKKAKKLGQKLIITTDHGTINAKNPTKVVGDKNISANLRYKTGRSLSYQEKDVFAVQNPKDIFLPSVAINSPFIFAKEDLFFAYPNNYNHFVKYFKNTYQHGGISLEEVIIPCAIYSPK